MKDIWKAPPDAGNAGWKVTPADIKQAREAAIARGEDRADLERQHAALVRRFGSEERLAEEWTKDLWREAFAEQLRPHRPAPLTPPSIPERSPGDRRRLYELIQQYPKLAEEILGDVPRPDC